MPCCAALHAKKNKMHCMSAAGRTPCRHGSQGKGIQVPWPGTRTERRGTQPTRATQSQSVVQPQLKPWTPCRHRKWFRRVHRAAFQRGSLYKEGGVCGCGPPKQGSHSAIAESVAEGMRMDIRRRETTKPEQAKCKARSQRERDAQPNTMRSRKLSCRLDASQADT